jgi:hypothetical protein
MTEVCEFMLEAARSFERRLSKRPSEAIAVAIGRGTSPTRSLPRSALMADYDSRSRASTSASAARSAVARSESETWERRNFIEIENSFVSGWNRNS